MSRFFTSSVAATALMALLAGSAVAQEAAPAHATEAGQSEAKAPVELPQVLRDIGLTDVKSKATRHGQRVSAKLPDGSDINALLDDKGELRGLRAGRGSVLPANLIERLVPQPVRNQPIYGELGKINAIFLGDKGVMLSGRDAQSKPVRAAFAEDGTLMRFGRGDERGMDMGPDHGPKGHGKGHGDRDHKDKDHGDRDHKRHDRQDGADATPPTPDEVRAGLEDAGYTDIGQILQQGRVTIAQATNPEGEAVLVELGPKGRVVRELNR
ncbi:hypothetical protein [Paracoccus aestuariivivens]|uniref:PepSY domain-containing protein n=1 Tax=Paracoccus aestuariivivens TaxID=1820333 RepID=A0A6L6JC26_9RHOB|nr:hypothetical protein [Paracoccus aestuariivivens]MTH79672.1 hypothetical protein [Paracoccus aestuariivivens]